MEAKRKGADPLEPGRHRCARVEMSSNEGQGIHHERYDVWA